MKLIIIIYLLQTILGVIVIKRKINKETPIWMATFISATLFFNLIMLIYWIGVQAQKLLKV